MAKEMSKLHCTEHAIGANIVRLAFLFFLILTAVMCSTLCEQVRTSPTGKRPQASACKVEHENATKKRRQKGEGKQEEANVDAVLVYQAHQELIGRIQIPREQVHLLGQQRHGAVGSKEGEGTEPLARVAGSPH